MSESLEMKQSRERDLENAKRVLHACRGEIFKVWVITCRVLSEVRRQRLWKLDEAHSFEQWSVRETGHSRSQIYRWLHFYEGLYLKHEAVFYLPCPNPEDDCENGEFWVRDETAGEDEGYWAICPHCDGKSKLLREIPSPKRLLEGLSTYHDHPGIERLVEAALTIPKEDHAGWKAELMEVTEGISRDEAAERAQAEAAHKAKAVQRRELGEFLSKQKWTSRRYRSFVRSLPCCFSGSHENETPWPVDPHHVVPDRKQDFENLAPVRRDIHTLIEDKKWTHITEQFFTVAELEAAEEESGRIAYDLVRHKLKLASRAAMIAYLEEHGL